ncbi:MAG: hypothetical protein CMG94_01025 [Marinoscillum sp.]|nr:hypothetical protein [Marinoscillum sp.]OUX27188.1 MAG: hypothetical protein CBE22_00410 [Flammeovirgaceae bacterium TMED262]|tara:strand:+ start:826 stop:1272 length:447 start_codon:yes stop_codon:yes gene_type:complete
MEVNELLIPTILGGICLAISIYGLAVAKDRRYALGGVFLYSFIPISHRLGLFLEDPQDYFSFVTIIIFVCQAIISIPLGGFLSPNKDSVQKTWSLKVQSTILVINSSFAFIILTDPVVPTIIGVYHAIYSLMMLVAISKTLSGNMDMK